MARRVEIRALFGMAVLICGLAAAGHAQTIANGSFESGFSGWTRVDQLGSDGSFHLHTGAVSPVTGDPVPAPPGGLFAAMSDALGPGSHVLYQDFVVGNVPYASASLSFDLFIGNRADAFYTPATGSIDFAAPAFNQQARVDLMSAGVDPFSVAGADLLQQVFQTGAGDPLVSGYTTHSVDIASILNANLGKTLRLRFAEADNVFTFQMGVDNVDLDLVPVPEPAFYQLGGLLALGALGLLRLRRRA